MDNCCVICYIIYEIIWGMARRIRLRSETTARKGGVFNRREGESKMNQPEAGKYGGAPT